MSRLKRWRLLIAECDSGVTAVRQRCDRGATAVRPRCDLGEQQASQKLAGPGCLHKQHGCLYRCLCHSNGHQHSPIHHHNAARLQHRMRYFSQAAWLPTRASITFTSKRFLLQIQICVIMTSCRSPDAEEHRPGRICVLLLGHWKLTPTCSSCKNHCMVWPSDVVISTHYGPLPATPRKPLIRPANEA